MRPEKAILTLAEKQCGGMKHSLWKICNSNGNILKARLCGVCGLKKTLLVTDVFTFYIY